MRVCVCVFSPTFMFLLGIPEKRWIYLRRMGVIQAEKKVKLICINFAYGFSSMGIDGKKDSSKDQCCVL